ncbi:AAA family ATPase [Kibdelosporangium philippinense]|uniref:AAA family ATPase n=1 Tax=Kibdelosporangium philippinense TaxID=211113 RepID=A0ABS8Z4R9_9PSEU|nr:AAA domain-containing protein [Kibdelosporangium philippinense]MCE7002894.1 AAA family ATPase [Kibdelosporangium philippinense]
MTATPADDALRKTTSLMEYLAEVTDAAERDPVRDILSDQSGAPEPIVWLDELPDGVQLNQRPTDDVVLRVRPPKIVPEPPPPADVAGWIHSDLPRGADGLEPVLIERGPAGAPADELREPPNSVVRGFTQWLSAWRSWSKEQVRERAKRQLYQQLEEAAKKLEQQDDEYEFVLAVGLVQWEAPDGEGIRRHLVSEPVLANLDRLTAEITVSFVSGKRRFEDKEIFAGQDVYHADRGRAVRQDVLDCDGDIFSDQVMRYTHDWLGLTLDVPFESTAARRRDKTLPTALTVSSAPALLLRPRSRALLAEAYRRIAEALREPGAQVPVALAQLVAETNTEQRQTWLMEQGAAAGDVLGTDPLFPLPTNDEQMRVIELLRTETGVVVQGPPGTGKTHTIANLVSALLARGQRVLVTSQKDQALKVLREKIPDELRKLCVLLAGGSRDAAKELEQGLQSLSNAIASPTTGELPKKIRELAAERHEMRSRAAGLNNRIRELREVESVRHPAVTPGFSATKYAGTLTEIVREVKRDAPTCDWIPTVDPSLPDLPPLQVPQLLTLLRLLRSDTPARRARAGQEIPSADELPQAGELADTILSERQALETAHTDTSETTTRLAELGLDRLRDLQGLRDEVRMLLAGLGFGADHTVRPERDWVGRVVDDRLAGRRTGLWGHLYEVLGEAARLQAQLQTRGVSFEVEIEPFKSLGAGRGLLQAGKQLRDHVAQGRKLRSVLPKSAAQKQAADFLAAVRVDGKPPTELPQLEAALGQLEAQVAAAQLVRKWAEAGVVLPENGLTWTLSELADNEQMLVAAEQLGEKHDRVRDQLVRSGLAIDVSTVANLTAVLDAVPGALKYVELEQARTQVDALYRRVHGLATMPAACPELGGLLQAIGARDPEAYRRGLDAVSSARAEHADEHHRASLARTLRGIHPVLYDVLESTAGQEEWETRLNQLASAWAWSKAQQFVRKWRNADEERRLVREFDQAEARVKQLTTQLAAAEALHACVSRMSDLHARALRSYGEHMRNVGAGSGKKAREYRKAARAAMEKAKDAVPAWVVPLPNLLENITPNKDAFDVVIVDEASQVGLEQLFLLWMAPRVIVVGDDKQCTPGENRMSKLDDLFESLRNHLADIDNDIRTAFTSKSNLYGVLTARSGKNAVVRLREHFRCMPEIINWSSREFYGEDDSSLIPLRERTAADLDPLKVVHVEDAYVDGRDAARRNTVEAKRIVDEMVSCIADPRYQGKTFGVVVLLGTGQVKLLEHEISAAISAEERAAREIRVGNAPNFQGDERDIIFLSTVATEAPRSQAAPIWQQIYNVAASRAKDQMWLFTSVPPHEYKPGDLRASLASYMLDPPSVFGTSPALEEVSETEHCEPFESLFEQRVFREIKKRGHHVVPQYAVGTRRLDLVVVGDGGRLAVECDGHRWHTSLTQQASDARRDLELRRMRWEVVRIRESEFEFDPEKELAPLWQRLDERGIHPRGGDK